MVKVRPLPLHLLMRLGKQLRRFSPTMAPFLAAAHASLRRFQRAFGLAIPTGREDAHAIREGGKRLYSQIYAGFLTRRWEWP